MIASLYHRGSFTSMRAISKNPDLDRTPAGVPAISRVVERSDTPGSRSKIEVHPGGVPAPLVNEIDFCGNRRGPITSISSSAATPPGSKQTARSRFRGRRSAQPPANRCDPSGVELISSALLLLFHVATSFPRAPVVDRRHFGDFRRQFGRQHLFGESPAPVAARRAGQVHPRVCHQAQHVL